MLYSYFLEFLRATARLWWHVVFYFVKVNEWNSRVVFRIPKSSLKKKKKEKILLNKEKEEEEEQYRGLNKAIQFIRSDILNFSKQIFLKASLSMKALKKLSLSTTYTFN